jgi:ATP-dependent Zn protease
VARKTLIDNKPTLEKIAEKLVAQETIEGEDLDAMFNGLALPLESEDEVAS